MIIIPEGHKQCSRCSEIKIETEFAKNQYGKNNRIVRRAYCKDCGKKSTPIAKKSKDAYERENPRPILGDEFKCPICERNRVITNKNQVCLDHDHNTGKIRGYICGDCNASIGRLGDSVPILKRAIKWLKGTLTMFFSITY